MICGSLYISMKSIQVFVSFLVFAVTPSWSMEQRRQHSRLRTARRILSSSNNYDGSICTTMIPPSTLAPDDSTCWKWWDAFEDGTLKQNPPPVQKGCDYTPCQQAVCACDDYCCTSAWDLSCRGHALEPGDTGSSNYFAGGCSANLLCCEQETAFPKSPSIPSSKPTTECTPDSTDCCATMIPPSLPAPDDSSCWQWWDVFVDGAMAADATAPSMGCDYAPCQEAVCACDDYCCRTAWDLSCRGSSDNFSFVDGCSAKQLCCEQDTAIPKPPVTNAPSGLSTLRPSSMDTLRPSFFMSIPISAVPIQMPLSVPVPPNIEYTPTSQPTPVVTMTSMPPFLTTDAPTSMNTTLDTPVSSSNSPDTSFPTNNFFLDPPTIALVNDTDAVLPINTTTSIPPSNECTPENPNCCETMLPPSPNAPDNSTCWQWYDPTSNSNTPRQKGCDYTPCSQAVCACDDYCCVIAWDLSCRGYNEGGTNFYQAGCSASLLCCEQKDPPIIKVGYALLKRLDLND